MKRWFIILAAVAAVNLAVAAEVGGVKFDDKVRLGNAELSLNGAGIRKKAVFKV